MWLIDNNKELDTFNWSAKDNPIDSGSKECYKGAIIGYPIAYGGYNEYFEKTTGSVRIILNETVRNVDLKKRSLTLSDGTVLTGDIIVSSMPIDELYGFSLGELPFAGREFLVFVLPCRQVFPADIRFCHYTQHERYTRIVEYKKLTYYDSPDTLLGMEIPSRKNKLYPYMIKRHLAAAEKYIGSLPPNVFSIGRAGTYKYSTIEQTIVQSFAVFEKITGKSTEAMGEEFYNIGDIGLIRERKGKV